MLPTIANQAARRPTPAKMSNSGRHGPKASSETAAAPKQKFARRVPAPSSDFPSRAAHAPSRSAAAANAHEPFRILQGFLERLLRPALLPAERPDSCPRPLWHRRFQTRRRSALCVRVSLAAERDSQSPHRARPSSVRSSQVSRTHSETTTTPHAAAISDSAKAPRRQLRSRKRASHTIALFPPSGFQRNPSTAYTQNVAETQTATSEIFWIQVPPSPVPANGIRPRRRSSGPENGLRLRRCIVLQFR